MVSRVSGGTASARESAGFLHRGAAFNLVPAEQLRVGSRGSGGRHRSGARGWCS